MRTSIALLLTLPLFACEPESVMEHSGETIDDAGDEIAATLEASREDVEKNVEEVAD